MILLSAGYDEAGRNRLIGQTAMQKFAYNEDLVNELPIWLDDPITREEAAELTARANDIDPLFTSSFKAGQRLSAL